MSFESTRSISLQAASGADIAQRRFVTQGASGISQAGANAEAVGISLEAYDDSEFSADNASRTIPVALLDGAKIEVEAGAAVAVGALVTSDAQGRAVTAASTERILGHAYLAAGAAGEIMTIIGLKGALAAP